jgi:DNA-binding transcriptional regulator LsrR (DeoR family)
VNDDQLNARVAWLYYLENLTQAEIGERLGLTRARVNRMLSEARESGLVRISLNSKFSDCIEIEQVLREKFDLHDAVIVPTPEDAKEIASVIGMAAGAYLSHFLEDNRITTIGIGWGATLRETIRQVTPANYSDLWITSMMGGLSRGLELNTFEISGELARLLQAQCSYLAAPIYAGSARSRDTILEQEVFKDVLGRIDRIDLALLSMGDLSPRSLLVRHGLPGDVSTDELRKAGAVGDVLGQFIDAKGKVINHGINKRAIALPLDRLSRVKTVMLIAGGANKTRVIAAALRGRIGNVLVSDQKTVAAAIDLIERES